MSSSLVTTRFAMTDGRELTCEFYVHTTPDSYWEPGDCEVSEPEYYIDGDEVDYKDLPKGLNAIADKLYEAGPGEYGYKETYERGDDYDPEDL